MTLRNVVLKVHLYLGLAAGLVLMVVCFTGALLTFEHEIEEAMHADRYFIEEAGERLSLDEVLARVGAAMPEAKIRGLAVFTAPGRTVEVAIDGGSTAYVNPFDGAVIEHVVRAETGWHFIVSLHRWLLAGDVGKLIVGISVLTFLVILISGVWVWWPKSRKQLRARTRVGFGMGWRRLNFDLHVSLGIFCAVFLFAMAFTGLMWSFKWFNAGMYAVAGTEAAPSEKPAARVLPGVEAVSVDAAWAAAAAAEPSDWYRVMLPEEPGAAFAVRVMPRDAAHAYGSEVLFVDPYSAAVVGRDRVSGRPGGAQLRLWFHVIHFGTIGGLPTQIIWFVAALVGATFPLTGALIWYNRNRRRWARARAERRAAREVGAAG